MQPGGEYMDDTGASITDVALRALAVTEGPLTFTCAVPGSGARMAINRDEDIVLDGLDNCVAIANDNQLNFDGDAQGDVCDSDDDNDAVSDEDEALYGTNSMNPDTDGDFFTDGEEIAAGSDPLDLNSTPNDAQVPALPWVASLFLLWLLLIVRRHTAGASLR